MPSNEDKDISLSAVSAWWNALSEEDRVHQYSYDALSAEIGVPAFDLQHKLLPAVLGSDYEIRPAVGKFARPGWFSFRKVKHGEAVAGGAV